MKLTELTMLSLQTAYMQKDPTTRALCTALDGELKKTIESIYNILMYSNLNTLGDTPFAHQLVDELAWQFHCDYYDSKADIETKKAVVKQSIKIHQKKGTPQAVIDLLKAAFPSITELYEWWQYGGKPYHFKVKTSSLNGVDMTQFLKALNSVKNARSYLDSIELLDAIESSMIFKSEKQCVINYSMLVGDFYAYVVGNSPVAFGITEQEYSFKDGIIQGHNGLFYTLSDDGTYYICTGLGTATETDIVIDDFINGIPVTKIGASAFNDCTSLMSVTIPDSVTNIGSAAFYNCNSLTSISIPDGVTFIDVVAFSDCTSLKRIEIPVSVTSIGLSAFSNCANLTVFYAGSQEEWNNIRIAFGNNALIYATIHYNS